jgi:hypothetical protein
LGKTLLAFSPADVTSKLLESPLEAVTQKTITDPDAFKKELDLIQRQGCALDNEEITLGIICVAAPVFGFNQEIICAISIAMPAYVSDDRDIEPEIEAIRKYSEMISDSFHHRWTARGGCPRNFLTDTKKQKGLKRWKLEMPSTRNMPYISIQRNCGNSS